MTVRLFGISEARYYCASFGASSGASEGSLDAFQASRLGGRVRTLAEGTPIFQEFRDCSLRDVERSLFFSASQYRRALDLMIGSASPWTHVTLYYGSFYAARALLAMFGAAVFGKSVVDVSIGTPGRQQLSLRRIGPNPGQESTTYSGSHQRFWDFFYNAVSSLRPFVAPEFAAALAPVSGDPVWQIDKRNEINYDSAVGLVLARDFARSFSKTAFPTSLPGALGTQFRVFESLLVLTYSYATSFGLQTDALNGLGVLGSLRDKVRTLVYNEKSPALIRQTRKSAVT